MIRFLVVVAIAFAASQFPSLYWHYTSAVNDELVAATQRGAPAPEVAALERQRNALLAAGNVERPLALIDNWDAGRAATVLSERWEPRAPATPVEWVHGGVGLVAGYLLTGLLFAPFRHRPSQPQPAERAPAMAPKGGGGGTMAARSRIPVSTGNLREAARTAKEAARKARAAAREQIAARIGRNEPDETSDEPVTPAKSLRGNDAIVFRRVRSGGAVTMSYDRPAAIARRRPMSHPGPIDRATILP